MRVLLEFGYFYLLFFKFSAGLIRIRVSFKSPSRICGIKCYNICSKTCVGYSSQSVGISFYCNMLVFVAIVLGLVFSIMCCV